MSEAASQARHSAPSHLDEEKLRLGFWQWQPAQRKLDWSAGVYRILGLEPFSEVPAFARLIDMVHPEDRPHVGDPTAVHDAATGESRFRIVRPDGETRRVRNSVAVHKDAAGRTTQLVGLIRDVTELSEGSPLLPGPMTPELIRAARGYLDWSANELAVKADVSFSTVRRAEAAGERHLRDGSVQAIRIAFEKAGLKFVVDEAGNPGLIAG